MKMSESLLQRWCYYSVGWLLLLLIVVVGRQAVVVAVAAAASAQANDNEMFERNIQQDISIRSDHPLVLTNHFGLK